MRSASKRAAGGDRHRARRPGAGGDTAGPAPTRRCGSWPARSKSDRGAGQAGQRIALNISGDADRERIARGDWLLAQRPPEAAEPFWWRGSGSADPPLAAAASVHAASHITGRISLLNDGLAEPILDRPLWLAENDRLVLRDIGARQTGRGPGAQAERAQARSASRTTRHGCRLWRRRKTMRRCWRLSCAGRCRWRRSPSARQLTDDGGRHCWRTAIADRR